MEVHHHPEVEKKGLKEYILEGLMIFLAVTMGFFAESIREHLSDRSKEYEYMLSIKKDLIADTASLNIWIPAMNMRTQYYDSLITCLKVHGPVKNGSDMYYYARTATRTTNYGNNDNTVLEMKSSGGFRLVHDRATLNDLVELEKDFVHYKSLSDFDQKEDMLIYPMLGDLFDASVFDSMVKADNGRRASEQDYATARRNTISRPPGNPQLRKYDEDEINLLIYYLHERKSSFWAETDDLRSLKELATTTIDRINKVYHLEDE